MSFTYDDLLRLPYDGLKHEIIGGVHYATEAHYNKDQRVVARLKSLLHYRLQPNFFYRSPGLRNPVMGIVNDAGVRTFAIEVIFEVSIDRTRIDPSTLLEYWLIEPAINRIQIFRRDGEALVPAEVGDTLTTPLVPDFSISVAELFT